MIEHKEQFGIRVHLEDDADVETAERWAKSGYWRTNIINRVETTRPDIASDKNMIDVHFEEHD